MAVESKPLLEVKNLKTWFYTPDGIVKAVNGVSFTLERGRGAWPGRRERLRQERQRACR